MCAQLPTRFTNTSSSTLQTITTTTTSNSSQMKYPPEVFRHLGLSLLGHNPERCRSDKFASSRFRSQYGTSWHIIADIWSDLVDFDHPVLKLEYAENYHLLWALMLLKTYQSETVLGGKCKGASEKTFRKWSWAFIGAIADLSFEKVRFFCSIFFIISSPCIANQNFCF